MWKQVWNKCRFIRTSAQFRYLQTEASTKKTQADAIPRSLLKLNDLSQPEIKHIMRMASKLKTDTRLCSSALNGRSLVLLSDEDVPKKVPFSVSFEVAMEQLGGYSMNYAIHNLFSGFEKGCGVESFSNILSHYADVIVANVTSYEKAEKLARHSHVPVISAETKDSNPCQILADLMTIEESIPTKDISSVRMAIVGDLESGSVSELIGMSSIMNIDISISPFPGTCVDMNSNYGITLKNSGVFKHDMFEAVNNADVVYINGWLTYDRDYESTFTNGDFGLDKSEFVVPMQVTKEIMSRAAPHAVLMHEFSVPDQELIAKKVEGLKSLVFHQAKNRVHVQKALLLHLVEHESTPNM